MKSFKIRAVDFLGCFEDKSDYGTFMEDLEILTRCCFPVDDEVNMDSKEFVELQYAKMSSLMAFLMRHRKILTNLQELFMFSEERAGWYLDFIKKGASED